MSAEQNLETLRKESEAWKKLAAERDELLDMLVTALPYVETAESDPAYKAGAVAKITRRMHAAIANVRQDNVFGGQMKNELADFPELTDSENEEIHIARRAGFAKFYPVFPDALTQARNTLAGAREFSKS